MISQTEIIEFIELNPSVNKRLDKALMGKIYLQEFNVPVKNTGCGGCVVEALNKIRVKYGYAATTTKEHKTTVKERLKTCSKCEYMVKGGFMGVSDTCGKFLNKLSSTPDLTNKGVPLCGCVLRGKAELGRKMLKMLGGCPDERWIN
tara:strand:+ start:539 stop:979 length:441 start_codon:yes stop_codon:yes gene_type:complete